MQNFWKRLFSRTKRSEAPRLDEPPSEKVDAIIAELKGRALPCLRLAHGEGGKSRLGGAPEMSGVWPRHLGRPLSLIAQLDLAEMRAAGGPDWLPSEGRLMFFYEFEYGGWGFDPKDAGSAVVRHETGSAPRAQEPDDLPLDMRFDETPVTFVGDTSLPSEERLEIDWRTLSGQEERDLEAAVEAWTPQEPIHQVGGYPSAVQNDAMELECQLVSNGLYMGKGKAGRKDEVERLKPGAADWRLLLQLDTDEEAEMTWGDTGRLYFWIREQDARASDFSRAWALLQCY